MDLKIVARFWKKAKVIDSGCWEWQFSTNNRGYGRFRANKQEYLAHRFSYMLVYGEIPENALILHSCDNRKCVNPYHLRTGTAAENTADMISRNRHVSGEVVSQRVRGVKNSSAKLTEDQVREIRKMYTTGKYSHRSLGEVFGVSKFVVGSIIRKTLWKHVK